eukprot:m.309177 g.309177  ORF g.309177 m.309177 type:complete len:90 (+) comp20199_c0_seq8:2322-2591(+)
MDSISILRASGATVTLLLILTLNYLVSPRCSLKRNMIDDAGAIALAAALKSNQTIVKLNLVHNYARGEGIAAMITAWGGRAVGDLTCNP